MIRPPFAPVAPRRRAVLLLAASAAALAGCGRGDETRSAGPSDPLTAADRAAVERAARTARTLDQDARLAAARAEGAATTERYRRLARDHRAHLDALGVPPAPTGATPSPSGPAARASTLAAAEQAGTLEALSDVEVVSPALAVLLARIAASRAVHADLLATAARERVPEPVPEPAPAGPSSAAVRSTLEYLVAGEHAAVFGYGTLTARLAVADRPAGRAAWARHTARRDAYEAALTAVGGRPPAAAPAYDLGTADDAGSGAAQAVALAARIEQQVLTTLLNGLAQVTGGWRALLARDAVEATRRLERWAGPVDALPL